MRPAWWTIARLELTLAIRDRGSVIWSLIAPIVMAWIFGSMFGGNADAPAPTRAALDGGANPPAVVSFVAGVLGAHGVVVDSAGAVRVELPDSLLAKLRDGQAATARIHKGDASDLRAQSVGANVRDALYRMAFERRTIETAVREGRTRVSPAGDTPLALKMETLGAAPRIPTGSEHTLPAMLVMFIMFQLTTFFLGMWVEDLRSGKTRRITMSPTRTRDILFAQIVARLAWGTLQVAIILGLGSMILGVHLEAAPLPLAALIGAYMLAAASLGMLLASFFKSPEKAGAIGVIVSLVMAALGGCWWPLEMVPDAMRRVALVFPTGQAMDALGEMTALGTAAPFPLSNVVVLLAMASIMMPFATRRMRIQMTS
ncbi:MAG: ABC transporter permease [Candidatus Krumholzibacteria bacterium]|nr:ABC transporter permease [Candidatus Krumholzibacteria bacterium]MDH5270153.1 ABC transporter permease [Candidatus Krumholzibacteria bacterium]